MRGSTLSSVLLVLMVAVTLTFVVAQSSVVHLQFATSLDNRQHARNLAESAVNEGLARVLDSEAFGKNRAAGSAIRVEGGSYPQDAYGYLTFNKGEAAAENTCWSTNNLGDGNDAGDRRPVPSSTVHLIGVGRCGNITQTVEVLYYRPPYPKALSATGPINATADLVVTGLRGGATYPGSPASIPENDRESGSIHSNATGAKAVDLGPGCNITGNVGASGQVKLDPSVRVGGEVRSDTNPQPVPNFDVEALIDQVDQVHATQLLTGSTGALTVDWFAGSEGPLDINGDLHLKDGVLWVKGNLHVTGRIHGNGFVLVKGDVKVDSGSTLEAKNVVALAATGDVALRAADKSSYYFQGLVYSEGDLEARDITVLGGMIANGPPGKGKLNLEHVNAIATSVTVNDLYAGDPFGSFQGDADAWPGGPFDKGPFPEVQVRANLRFKPDGSKVVDVNVVVFQSTTSNVIKWNHWYRDMTYDEAHALGWRIHQDDSSLPDYPHNDTTGDSFIRAAALAWRNPPARQLKLSVNNLLSPAEKSRILLWNSF